MRGETPQGDEHGEEQGDHRPDQPAGPSGKTLLIAALVVVALGYFLSVKLHEMGRLQDCVMSGRRNCASAADPSQ